MESTLFLGMKRRRLTLSANDDTGTSVSLYGDTALIGATSNDDKATNAGKVYVFRSPFPPPSPPPSPSPSASYCPLGSWVYNNDYTTTKRILVP